MNTESVTVIKEESLVSQQASLLDQLTTRLSHVQCELDAKNLTIHDQEAHRIVKNHVLAGSAMGLVPLPLFDLVALSGTQHNMLEQLCEHYGVDFDNHKIRSALLALLGGSLPTLTLLGLSSSAKLIPGIGSLAGNASLTVLGGGITYATGHTFSKHFKAGGTLDDVNVSRMKQFFKQEFNKGKQFLRQHTMTGGAK